MQNWMLIIYPINTTKKVDLVLRCMEENEDSEKVCREITINSLVCVSNSRIKNRLTLLPEADI